MSKEEMIMIEVPVSWAEQRAKRDETTPSFRAVDESCRRALDARKTKYEEWSKMRSTPWVANRVMRGEVECSGPQGEMVSLCYVRHSNTSRLVAAAPELLEVVIEGYASSYAKHGNGPLWDDSLLARAAKAIRAALPKDVADEVLGE